MRFIRRLITLFENDASSARPEGSMEVNRVYWWKHNCKSGQYSAARVHRSLVVKGKQGVETPHSIEDFDIALFDLPELTPQIDDGR